MPPPVEWAERRRVELRRESTAARRTWSSSRRPTRRRATRRTRGTSRSSTTGLTEPRWVRAIEIRPSTVKGRKITHHALARLQQQEDGDNASSPAAPMTTSRAPGCSWSGRSASRARSCAPNSGKLMLPGSKIVWDIHYHAVGEDITDQVELGIYFYPKGQEPKYRQALGAVQRHHRRQPQPRHPAELDLRRHRTSTS